MDFEDSFGVEQNNLINISATGEYDLPSGIQSAFFNSSCEAIIGIFQYGSESVISSINTPGDLVDLLVWIFVSQYWITLNDIGQIVPVDLPSTTNNIFVNDTLFQHFSSFIFQKIVPGFELLPTPVAIARNEGTPIQFLPLNDTNRLQPVDTTFFITYSCTERQLKGWFSILTSVFTADYAILAAAYGIFIFIAGGVQKRKDEGTSSLDYLANLKAPASEKVVSQKIVEKDEDKEGLLTAYQKDTQAGTLQEISHEEDVEETIHVVQEFEAKPHIAYAQTV
jgi:hypothetical protein